MLARQRQIEILRDLQHEGAVSVTQLAERFDVTDETIRRDLSKLAEGGQLVRTHGGAVLSESAHSEAPFSVRQVTNAESKRAIAQAAASLVRPGDVIAIDASTTGLEVAMRLPTASASLPITVVSNGVSLIHRLADRPGIRVISSGGEFDPTGACFVGSIAEATLEQFSFRHVFLSCRALDLERGAGESGPSHASIKRLLLSTADQAHLVVDSSKLTEKAMCYFAAPDRFASIVIDDGASPSHRDALTAAGVQVIVAPLEREPSSSADQADSTTASIS